MYRQLPMRFKILFWWNFISVFPPLYMLLFYGLNNVVVDNGVDVGPLKIIYSINLLLGIGMILSILYTKRIAVIINAIYGLTIIGYGIIFSPGQIILGIIMLILIFNKSILQYSGFITIQQTSKGKKNSKSS